jgi:hypothetical protein
MPEESKRAQIAIADALHLFQTFRGTDLTQTIQEIEKSVKGITAESYAAVLSTSGAKSEVLGAAGLVKQLAAQIDVVIHTLGILLCLPHILRPGEIVEYVSLGAGNTGRAFDLETNLRIAEFKFIRWQGGPESIRQNSVFKDFFRIGRTRHDERKIFVRARHRTWREILQWQPCVIQRAANGCIAEQIQRAIRRSVSDGA